MACGALSAAPASAAPAAADAAPKVGPYQLNFSSSLLYSLVYPDAQAQGVNDWGCVPRAGEHPVVLVHGTYANQYNSFARMAPELRWAGYCVYSFNYGTDGTDAAAQLPGVYGTTGLSDNGDELAAFADTVRARTGASKVDMVGWSQGGTIITDVLKKHGGGGVDDVVTLAGSHHGTTLSGLGTIAEAVGGDGPHPGRAGPGRRRPDQGLGVHHRTHRRRRHRARGRLHRHRDEVRRGGHPLPQHLPHCRSGSHGPQHHRPGRLRDRRQRPPVDNPQPPGHRHHQARAQGQRIGDPPLPAQRARPLTHPLATHLPREIRIPPRISLGRCGPPAFP
ncbi:putative lipase [Janibacter hoylei PVAS-1]|uniref:Putative lipase n=1 Tax=Janibacter hoylei PVAS-1 TaxID=1210046 RepID=K1E3I6_9MICO|nr:putative lipase [Janibacter hoylei PVAS-1]